MDGSVAWRAGLLQGVTLAVAAVVLALALEREFFEDWGWLAGPGVWAGCALVTGAVLRLPLLPVLAGAGVSGIPSLVAVLLGVHWAGTPLAVLGFALWCGWLAGGRRRVAVTA